MKIRLSGGSGIDLVVTSVSINLASMSAFAENVRLSGSAKDAAGNALANVIEGTAGNNSLFGAAGADTLIGGDGLDSLGGGAGLDVMVGGNGNDYYAVDARRRQSDRRQGWRYSTRSKRSSTTRLRAEVAKF